MLCGWEFVRLIGIGTELILLTIPENQASALSLAEVDSLQRQMDKRTPPVSQDQLPAADAMQLISRECLAVHDGTPATDGVLIATGIHAKQATIGGIYWAGGAGRNDRRQSYVLP